MFASPSNYLPPHGYTSQYPPFTTTPLSSPPLGTGPNAAFWDYSHTPAPTPQPQTSPFPGPSRVGQRRRRSEQIPRDGIPSFPSTPQPQRNSTTPAGFAPYYSSPSPRLSYAPSPTPAPPADFYYASMGPGGPMPPVTPSFSPHQAPVYAADHDFVSSPRPKASPRFHKSSPRSSAQRLYRKDSHIDSAYGSDEDFSFSRSHSHSKSTSHFAREPFSCTSSPLEYVAPKSGFRYNVEVYKDETYDSEEFETDSPRYRSFDQVPHSPLHNPASHTHERTRSRNSKSRTPGSDMHSPAPASDRRSPASREQSQIPQGYSTKNWDQSERPIMLLGSVFDANSLGKWIYDWTVYRHGTTSAITELAGGLWLLLIQLSGKMKRARECVETNRIKRPENLALVTEFVDSGERLWDRIKRLLKHCEEYMWKGAQASNGVDPDMRKGSPNVTMGKQSGKEFVDAMFGKDRRLEQTEKLMTGMRIWSERFDANCEDILRRPHV